MAIPKKIAEDIMANSVVIKVKYEDTLRRFNVPVKGQCLDLNMEGLRLKICSLFNFPSGANFTLTYLDEDDDLVTLVDDEDLHDVVRQDLDPVRITVSLKTDKTVQPCATKNESSMPRGSSSSSTQHNGNQNVAEVLKSVPEPLRDAFTKISTELSSKAASTSPILADLVDGFSKMGQQYLNVSPPGITNVSSHAKNCYDPNRNGLSRNDDAFIGERVNFNDSQTPSSVQPTLRSTTEATGEAEPPRPPLPLPFSHKGKNAISEPSSLRLSTSEGKMKKEVAEHSAAKSVMNVHKINCSKGSMKKRVSSDKETSRYESFQGLNIWHRPPFRSNIHSSPFGHSLWGEPENFSPPSVHDNFNKIDAMGSIFHKGVRCDGCGILPITGPRFKSKVKYDYDLCSICFGRMGNDLDYCRLDFPLPYKHPSALKNYYDPKRKLPLVPLVHPPWAIRKPIGKHSRSRLDCRFIMDVNIMDGTTMAPSTPFTKIWLMRNNGALPWHNGLQLLWIGGDRFSASDSVKIELPINGVDVGNEINIAVDFVAPELPGRYVSYWRMAEASGQKFGQRVWVEIQVDASVDLTCEVSPGPDLNLNLPPQTTGALGPQALDVKNEPALNFEDKSPSMVEQRRNIEIEDLNFPINNDLLVASDVLCPTATAASSSEWPSIETADSVFDEALPVPNPDTAATDNHESPSAPPATLYPIIDMSEGSSSAQNDKSNLEQDQEKKGVEETLLKELEEMGFKQIDLNKEVLRVNEYDLERSVDDLCGVSEWDPMLEELKEMGFEDKDTNRKLLAKNNGSITRVVMDLIAGEE